MSNIAQATVGYGPVPGFPANSVVANIVVHATSDLRDATGAFLYDQWQTISPGTPTVNFPNVPDCTLTVTAQAVDQNGKPFGSPVSASKVVAAGTVTLSVPTSITVAQTG